MTSSEKWAVGYLAVLAGANISGAAGAIACQSAISLGQLVIDDDIYGGIFRQMRGIAVTQETLAAEAIARVGAGGSFLADEHTLAHYRTEYWYSRLAKRRNAAAWEASGSQDAVDRAAEAVQAILRAPAVPAIPDMSSRTLDAVLTRAEEALAGIEMPV